MHMAMVVMSIMIVLWVAFIESSEYTYIRQNVKSVNHAYHQAIF